MQERGYAEDAEGAIMERLGFALRMYAYGMRRYIADASAAVPGPPHEVSRASVEVFTRQLMVATVAFFEYTYIEGDTVHTRAYISRSNRGFDRFILRTTTDLAVPAQTEADYLQDSTAIKFVRAPSPREGSNVVATRSGNNNRENDAEIKVLQLLSAEIAANPAMRGGTLVAYVSQQPCESCTPALRYFARETAANVRVNYVFGGPEAGRETTLYRALRQAREAAAALLLARFVGTASAGTAP